MAITAYIIIDLHSRQLKIDYDKAKDAKRDYEAYIKTTKQEFEFSGMVKTVVRMASVGAVSIVDIADYEKRKGPTT